MAKGDSRCAQNDMNGAHPQNRARSFRIAALNSGASPKQPISRRRWIAAVLQPCGISRLAYFASWNGECLVHERRELQCTYNSMIRKFVDQTAAPVPFRSSTRCRIVIQVWLSLKVTSRTSHFASSWNSTSKPAAARESFGLLPDWQARQKRGLRSVFSALLVSRLRSNGFHRLSDLWRQASHHFLPKAIRPILPTCLILNCHSSNLAKI